MQKLIILGILTLGLLALLPQAIWSFRSPISPLSVEDVRATNYAEYIMTTDPGDFEVALTVAVTPTYTLFPTPTYEPTFTPTSTAPCYDAGWESDLWLSFLWIEREGWR